MSLNFSVKKVCPSGGTADLREHVRQLEADLADQGVALYPNTAVGQRAHSLWCKIRPHLLRGGAVYVTCSTLNLGWHREELRRARNVLVQMGLIRPRVDGLYVLGRYDRLDELARDQFLELQTLDSVMVGLSGLMAKSKTQKRS
jgi:hypothetical protein